MHRTLKAVAAALLLAVGSNAAQAQVPDLFERSTTADLTPQQEKALNALKELPTSGSVEVIKIKPDVLNAAETLKVQPSPDSKASFNVQNTSRAGSNKTVEWQGKVEGAPHGDATLTTSEAGVTGTIFAPEGTYKISPLGGGLSAFIRVDPSKFPDDEPPSMEKKGRGEFKAPAAPDRKSDASEEITKLTVLVAYTKNVTEKVVDPLTLAINAVKVSNLSYANSGVKIELVLSPSSPVKENYTETGSYDDDLAAFRDPNDNKMDDIHDIRARDKANLVVLLVDNKSYCGLASDIHATASTAFAAVYHDCAVENLSFPHELGHLQGARHNKAADDTPGYNHGYINTTTRKRTVMAYGCSDSPPCVRVPQWSRPPDWGSASGENNARVLNETRYEISSWGIGIAAVSPPQAGAGAPTASADAPITPEPTAVKK
jgi:hypothetical protein